MIQKRVKKISHKQFKSRIVKNAWRTILGISDLNRSCVIRSRYRHMTGISSRTNAVYELLTVETIGDKAQDRWQ